MKIVILGGGDTGRFLANHLSLKKHNIKVIDVSEIVVGKLNDTLDVGIQCGNGAQPSVLAEANVHSADLFMGLTDDQHVNIISASIAKAMGCKKTIARVDVRLQTESDAFDFRNHFSIDYVFSSEMLVAFEINKFFSNPEASTREQIGRGRITVQNVLVSNICQLLNTPFSRLLLPQLVRVAVIHRGEEVIIPSGQDCLQANDRVVLFGEPSFVDELASLLKEDASSKGLSRVTIFGGGNYGYTLAKVLTNKPYKIRILENDRNVCTALSKQLPEVVIVHGDGRSVELLKEEQIEKADFFIGMSDNDEDNLIACLQAKSIGVKHVIPLMHSADNSSVVAQHLDPLSFLATVSPREVNLRDLVRFVESRNFHTVGYLSDRVELVQFTVHENAAVSGKLIKDVNWPKGASLVTLLRNENVLIPKGKDQIKGGDSVYAVVLPESRKSLLKVLTR